MWHRVRVNPSLSLFLSLPPLLPFAMWRRRRRRRWLRHQVPHISFTRVGGSREVAQAGQPEPIIIVFAPPTVMPHTVAIVLHDYCARYAPFPDPPFVCYTPNNVGYGNSV